MKTTSKAFCAALVGLILGVSTITVCAQTIAQWLANGIPVSSGPITPTSGMVGVGNGTSFTYSTTPAINGTNFTNVAGGTGNSFFAVSGPLSTTKTFTFPNANTTVLTTNALVTSAQGGSGVNNAGTFTNATNSTITGGGTLALGGFTLTAPATGSAALLGTANIFTAANSWTGNAVAKTTTYAATTADYFITVSGASGAWSLSLPAAASNTGRIYLIKRTDNTTANLVTIDPNASETIDGALTTALIGQYAYIHIQCDGSNWHTLGASDFVSSAQNTLTNFPTSTQYGSSATDAVTLTLPAGAWDMTLMLDVATSGTAPTAVLCGIGTATGNSNTGLVVPDTYIGVGLPTSAYDVFGCIQFSVNLTASQQYYLKAQATYAATVPQWRAKLTARRTR